MVQLQQVQLRLKSVRNIQKITKTMKMVSASKFHKAEKQLAGARPFFYGPLKFYQSIKLQLFDVDIWEEQMKQPPYKKKTTETPMEKMLREDKEMKEKKRASEKELKRKILFVAITSDKGFCGGVHSGVGRRIRLDLTARAGEVGHSRVACIGDKARALIRPNFPKNILMSCNQLGRLAPEFVDASKVAEAIIISGYKYDEGDLYYNKYFTPIKYELSVITFHGEKDIYRADNLYAYDEVEDVDCYTEFTIASLIYYALKESAASEQSARMSAMDSATKNADEMIRKLALLFNRTRQALITRDLIEIISGAIALTETDK